MMGRQNGGGGWRSFSFSNGLQKYQTKSKEIEICENLHIFETLQKLIVILSDSFSLIFLFHSFYTLSAVSDIQIDLLFLR